jgi:RNA polymerase sigma-70 factor, ECF subfamily
MSAQPPIDASRHDSLRGLALAAAAGDERAFARIHQRLAGGLRRFLARRCSREDVVEDLAQRTWTAVWEALRRGSYDPERAALTTFLYGVAYKSWLQFVRAGASRPTTDLTDAVAAELFETEDPAQLAASFDLLDAVRDCVQRATHAAPDSVGRVLGFVAEGASEREMAGQLGLAPSTINARKKVALEAVRNCLKNKGFIDIDERSPGSLE